MIGPNNYEAAVILSWKACARGGAAQRLYRRVRRQGAWARLWSALAGKPGHLLALEKVKGQRPVQSRSGVAMRTVAIKQIRGSEKHCAAFDAEFRPLGKSTEHRWLRAAAELQGGKPLPPVRLIRVGNVYFVRDGHYIISVVRAVGQVWVEAEVEVWHLAGLLPAGEIAAAYCQESSGRANAAKVKQAGVV